MPFVPKKQRLLLTGIVINTLSRAISSVLQIHNHRGIQSIMQHEELLVCL